MTQIFVLRFCNVVSWTRGRITCLRVLSTMLLQSKASFNALLAFQGQLSSSRVDNYVDNRVLKFALDNDGCKNTAIIKNVLRYSSDCNCGIQTFYVPSGSNPTDAPSRYNSDLGCMLTPGACLYLGRFFGTHSMSLDSNC